MGSVCQMQRVKSNSVKKKKKKSLFQNVFISGSYKTFSCVILLLGAGLHPRHACVDPIWQRAKSLA